MLKREWCQKSGGNNKKMDFFFLTQYFTLPFKSISEYSDSESIRLIIIKQNMTDLFFNHKFSLSYLYRSCFPVATLSPLYCCSVVICFDLELLCPVLFCSILTTLFCCCCFLTLLFCTIMFCSVLPFSDQPNCSVLFYSP
jgi:hypothetical protein